MFTAQFRKYRNFDEVNVLIKNQTFYFVIDKSGKHNNCLSSPRTATAFREFGLNLSLTTMFSTRFYSRVRDGPMIYGIIKLCGRGTKDFITSWDWQVFVDPSGGRWGLVYVEKR